MLQESTVEEIEEVDEPEFRTTYNAALDKIIADLPSEQQEAASALIRAGNGTAFARMIPESRGEISRKADETLDRLAQQPKLLSALKEEVHIEGSKFNTSKSLLSSKRSLVEELTFAYYALLTRTPWKELSSDIQQALGKPEALPWKTTVEQQHGYVSTYDQPEASLAAAIKSGQASIIDGAIVVLPRSPNTENVSGKKRPPSIGLTITPIQTEQGVIPPGMWLDITDRKIQALIDAGRKDITTQAEIDGLPLFGLARPALPVPVEFGALPVENLIKKATAYAGSIRK